MKRFRLPFLEPEVTHVRASSAPLALMSAISYLESRFGSQTEYAHACVGELEPTRIGDALRHRPMTVGRPVMGVRSFEVATLPIGIGPLRDR